MSNKYLQGDIVMDFRDLSSIGSYTGLHLQNVRRLHVTVEVLDDDLNTIDTIQGLTTGGSLSVSNSSLIRRTGDLSFVLYNNLYPSEKSKLWMTNRIRVYAGLENMSTAERTITHFCLGTFYITEPEVSVAIDGMSIDITLEDNMMRFDQQQLESKIVFEANTPVHVAMTKLINTYGEFNYDIEISENVIPYKLEFDETQTVLEALETLRDLYMDWVCYYDVKGMFIFKKMDIQKPYGEPIAWSFQKEMDLITSFKETFSYKEVKNKVIVVGQINEKTGITPRAEASILPESSPFHHSKIGVRTKVFNESSLANIEQCEAKAKYELYKSSTFQKKLSLSLLPIYFLDANDVIEVINPNTKETEHYIIDSIDIPLGIGEEATIGATKLYYDHFDVNGSLEKYQKSADIVIAGIENKGWLSLAEQRIKKYYGMEGDGSKLIVQFVYQEKYGTTAYVTGFYGNNTQTMTIDLADFENPTGDSGDLGQTKAEYADRILGHEMIHAVMNNHLGIAKTSTMPTWFKEGIAELIHGADERLKSSIVTDKAIDSVKVDKIITLATNLMNGAVWDSVSDSYSAGYVICKYLDKKLEANNKSYIDLFSYIKSSLGTGDIALREAIVSNTKFATYQEFVNDFSANAKSYIMNNVKLNIGVSEIDTGSIGGTDHRGTVHLDAETIFDNSTATKGLASYGFNIEFKRP